MGAAESVPGGRLLDSSPHGAPKDPSSLYDTIFNKAEAIRYSDPVVQADAMLKAYQTEFAAALGLVGAPLPFTAGAISVWNLVSRMVDFRYNRNKLAKRIASLDGSIALLRAQYHVLQSYWDPKARRARGLRGDCITACDVPEPRALTFWEQTLHRLKLVASAKKLTPAYFTSRLQYANELVAIEMGQLHTIFMIQQLADQGHLEQMNMAASTSLRNWRAIVSHAPSTAIRPKPQAP